jgi:cytochrome c2
MKTRIALFPMLVCLLFVSIAMAQSQSTPDNAVSDGKTIFQQNCARCHNADSTETKTGPGLKGLFKRDQLPVSGRPVSEETVHKQLTNPFKQMPSFSDMSQEKRNAVVSYLKTL